MPFDSSPVALRPRLAPGLLLIGAAHGPHVSKGYGHAVHANIAQRYRTSTQVVRALTASDRCRRH
jgi:hypothetical protein